MKQEITKLITVMDEIRAVDKGLSASAVQILLIVAQHPGIQQPDLLVKSKQHKSSVSRSVRLLGTNSERLHQDGLGLIANMPDPCDGRRKVLKLTAKGERFVKQLIEVISDN